MQVKKGEGKIRVVILMVMMIVMGCNSGGSIWRRGREE
ncbi:hypothetical protein BDCR2A_01756 [Borrelia duttonii CR2A]|uniref:Variable outer membrane protein n=1 Tax=Borrelia duttonii CR2A TaxID=1432657 RepID=W6TJH7_9SPIR|nr:hypothetical protein BDCR2A_01756 [Borrelia duttonii CR2A]